MTKGIIRKGERETYRGRQKERETDRGRQKEREAGERGTQGELEEWGEREKSRED